MPIINVACKQCGKKFAIQRWEAKRRRFCGRKCFYEFEIGHKSFHPDPKEERWCAACGKSFLVGGRGRPSKRTKLCSWECQRASRYRRGRKANELSATDAAYIAGFLDGEGCISLVGRNKGCAHVRINFSNSFKPVLDWIKCTSGLGTISAKKPYSVKHKTGFSLVCYGDGAHSLLKQLRQYLRIKVEQADLGIATHERLMNPAFKSDRSWQAEWKLKMHAFNKRGRVQD